ncbi:hypothetical protein [Streptomyces sp. NPDC048349]|uniref:hypothetical protein n=1 Tax=Streptomyces sp. NPDC048349 TaxID=3155486 RepID=UPI0034214CE9
MSGRNQDPRSALLPDAGAAVDEHGRPPGAPSRTGPGEGPPVDPDRVERARLAEKHGKAGEEPPVDGVHLPHAPGGDESP